MPSDCRIAPRTAVGARYPAFIEPPCNRPRSLALRETAEDFAYDLGLSLIYPALPSHRLPAGMHAANQGVTVAPTTTRLASRTLPSIPRRVFSPRLRKYISP